MLTVRDRPLLVVPSMRWPATTAAEGRRRAADVSLGAGQVDIAPAQVEQLPAAGTGIGGQVVEGEQAMSLRHVEEDTQLPGRPYLPGLTGRFARPLSTVNRIRRKKLIYHNGVPERLSQNRVDILWCRRHLCSQRFGCVRHPDRRRVLRER